MTTLHIVRQSAFTSNDFAQCKQVTLQGDLIVFTDDACYNLTHPLVNSLDEHIKVMAIKDHCQARAVTLDNSKASFITLEQLVKLTFDADRVLTWQ